MNEYAASIPSLQSAIPLFNSAASATPSRGKAPQLSLPPSKAFLGGHGFQSSPCEFPSWRFRGIQDLSHLLPGFLRGALI